MNTNEQTANPLAEIGPIGAIKILNTFSSKIQDLENENEVILKTCASLNIDILIDVDFGFFEGQLKKYRETWVEMDNINVVINEIRDTL